MNRKTYRATLVLLSMSAMSSLAVAASLDDHDSNASRSTLGTNSGRSSTVMPTGDDESMRRDRERKTMEDNHRMDRHDSSTPRGRDAGAGPGSYMDGGSSGTMGAGGAASGGGGMSGGSSGPGSPGAGTGTGPGMGTTSPDIGVGVNGMGAGSGSDSSGTGSSSGMGSGTGGSGGGASGP